MFSYNEDTYEETSPPAQDKSGQDALRRTWEANANFYLNDRKDVLSFFITWDDVNSRDRRFTYDAWNWAVSYFKPVKVLNWDLEFYTRFKYTKADYETPALLWPVGHEREDEKYNFYFVVSKNFWKRCFASVSYNYLRNESNTDLYSFHKYIYGFSIGARF
jgi:hypothetical protein